MVKILLFLFAARPLIDCLIISLMLLNLAKIPEASSYIALIIIMLHYGYMGLKEIFQK